MAKLIYSAITSLDGYVADESGNFDWAAPDEEVHAFVNDLERPVGTYLYGRRMYEVMVFWETAGTLEDEGPVFRDFAELWQAADKIVYSKTLDAVSSARTRLERDFDPEAVRRLKADAVRDLTVGGPELAAHALRAGLVDEIHLFVTPVAVGGGTRSLPDNVRLKLELLDVRRFGSGVVHLHYRLPGEPGSASRTRFKQQTGSGFARRERIHRMKRDLIMSAWQERFGRALPEKIICVGLNYRDHAAEQGVELPQEPLLFGKFPNALLDPGEPIVLPRGIGHVDSEAELAVVIGRQARNVDVADALEVVEGYVCANDVSARDLQFKDGQWLRAKGFDTFCPISTELVPVEQVGDGRGLRVVQRLNGEIIQDSSTDSLIFSVPEIVAHASTVFTLEPGDLILTGTPAGVGVFRDPKISMAGGDRVEVEVERVGILASPVVAA